MGISHCFTLFYFWGFYSFPCSWFLPTGFQPLLLADNMSDKELFAVVAEVEPSVFSLESHALFVMTSFGLIPWGIALACWFPIWPPNTSSHLDKQSLPCMDQSRFESSSASFIFGSGGQGVSSWVMDRLGSVLEFVLEETNEGIWGGTKKT